MQEREDRSEFKVSNQQQKFNNATKDDSDYLCKTERTRMKVRGDLKKKSAEIQYHFSRKPQCEDLEVPLIS